MLFGLVDRARQVSSFVDRVGVGEQQPAAFRLLRRGPAGIVLPREAATLELRRRENGHSCIASSSLSSDLRGAIGRLVVDDQQLPLLAEREPALRLDEQRVQTASKNAFLVPRRNNDA